MELGDLPILDALAFPITVVGFDVRDDPDLARMPLEKAIKQIESTFAIEERTLKNGVAPFFRFPYLADPKPVRDYLASRNIAVFSIDVNSSDWRTQSPTRIVDNVMKGLQHTGGGNHPVP